MATVIGNIAMQIEHLRSGTPMHRPETAHAESVRVARETFDGCEADQVPRIFQLVWPEDDRIGFIHAPWGDERERLQMLAMVRALIHKLQPAFYSVMSEVYWIERRSDRPREKRLPSDCEDRREALFVLTVAPYLEPIATRIEILPGRKLGEVEDMSDCVHFGGDLADLFT